MRKLLALILVCAMCLSLCACGGNSTEKAASNNLSNEKENVIPVETASKDDYYQLGQAIDIGFATMSFASAKIAYTIGETVSVTAQDGMRFFGLVGTIENTGGKELTVNNLCAEMVFNDEFTYTARATIGGKRNTTNMTVAPLAEVEYWVYAEIPDALLDKLSFCEVHISINDDFASYPESVKKGDHKIRLRLEEDVCKAAIQSLDVATDFFAECPILPTPVNYVPVRQASTSSSSRNGKVTSIKYGFSVAVGRSDDVKDMYEAYISKLQNSGFTNQSNSGTICDIYADGNKLATVSVNNGRIEFDIVPGNENLTSAPTGNVADMPEISSGDTAVKMGETIQTDYVSMSLETYGSNNEIRSGSTQYGMYTYLTSDNGDPYFYLYGTLKNLGGNPIDIRNIYVQFCFDGKYNYKGSVDGVSSDSNRFINDVSPLASVNYYMYAAVPQELISTYTNCYVRIGFTEDFDYKVVDVNDLPQFDNCDNIFSVELDTSTESTENVSSTVPYSNNSVSNNSNTGTASTMNDGKIAVYGSPSKSSDNIIGHLEENASVEIARTESVSDIEWAYIVGDSNGWVIRSQINGMVSGSKPNSIGNGTSEEGIMKGEVTAAELNIRKEASRDSDIVGSYNKGDVVTILEQKDGWGRTDKGWIVMNYLNVG